MSGVLAVLVTGPDEETLASLCATLVEERFCACANILPRIRSIYRWEGAVEDEAEALAILKTTEDRLQGLTERVRALHPYDVPEVVALPVAGGSEAYLGWVRESV